MSEIRLNFDEKDMEKIEIIKVFLKISKNTKLLRFLINEKFQLIQKLEKKNINPQFQEV